MCFDKLQSGDVDYAVVPLENSINGLVVFTYSLLRDWFMPPDDGPQPQFVVVGEQYVPIHHNVLTRAADLSQVTRVYSHPQVWGQVTEFMRNEQVRTWTTIDTDSTAKAAQIVAQDASNTSACIGSLLSAELYDLLVAVPDVEDKKDNTTRFLVLARRERATRVADTPCVTALMFVLNQNEPGALCEALDSFRRNRVNLHSIASRPSGRAQWQYAFFVEVDGDASSDNVAQSIRALGESCSHTAVLGLFVRKESLRG